MPLDARKAAHIRTQIAATFAGRAQPVILTLRNPDGSTSTLTVNAVFRTQGDFSPQLEGAVNDRFHIGAQQDIFAIFDAGTVSLQQLRSTIWASVQLPGAPPPVGAQVANRYTLLDVEPIGMLPGSTRFFTKWTRQH